MEAVLSDLSALAYWRSHSERLGDVLILRRMVPERKGRATIEAPSSSLADDLASWGLAGRNDIHLLVSRREDARRIKGVTCTVCTCELPARSFVRVLGQVYAVCPELLFIQMAQQLELVPLLELGHELCGTYRLVDGEAIYGVEPLTNVSKLKSYTERAEGVRGRRRALQAIKWLADSSASPAETALSIMFRLPYRYGGYGLGNPVLNYEIELNETASHILGRRTMRSDLFWIRAKHATEYDGKRYHSSREQAEYDERRRNAYVAMGMNVTVLTTRHLCNLHLLDEMVEVIRKSTGIRQRKLPADYPFLHEDLFNEVFAWWISLKNSGLSSGEAAWRAASYDAPEEPW